MTNSAPSPGREFTSIMPPCARTTPSAIASPSPVPCPRVVKNGSNIRACVSEAMPGPLSRTLICSQRSFFSTAKRMTRRPSSMPSQA
jgi:hypothetical protein